MKNFNGISDIAAKDPYRIRGYDRYAFDQIIDIGANTGQFALTAYFLYPEAKIYSYEPCFDTYNILCDNLAGIPNMTLINRPIGDGGFLYFKSSGGRLTCTGNMFKKYDTGNYALKSTTIKEIFEENFIQSDKHVLLKLDCEGGEQYVLKDEYADLLRQCKQLSFEVHFKCSRPSRTSENFKDLPNWEQYNEWIQKTFKQDYNILYHKSRKHLGIGVYVITRK